MSVKFLHSADWQMGMQALQAGEKAKEVRAKRFETAARVAALAKREAVDFVLLAGDLFEHHDVDDVVVRKTVAVLNDFAPIPVFVLPGNHDPLVAGGVWDRQRWQDVGKHVRLLREPTEVLVQDDVALYPSPLTQKQSRLDPTAWIPPRGEADRRIRIGIAHGALDVLPEDVNFPIAPTRAAEVGLDYLALGDWHGFRQSGRTVYPGTMEQTSFSEKDPGNVVVVEIAHAGAEPVVSKHRVGQLVWSEHRPTLQDVTDVENLRTLLIQTGPQATPLSSQILRVTPQIAPEASPVVLTELQSLRKELIEGACFIDWPEEALALAAAADVVLPEGVLADVDFDLAAILGGKIPEGPGREMASADPTVVQEARALIRRLATEVAG